MRPAWGVAVLCCWAGLSASTSRAREDGTERAGYLDWSGSADWEYFRSDSATRTTEATSDALRQTYSVDVAGSVWDPRFARFSAGLDLFRSDRSAAGAEHDSRSLGYRTILTFFPGRPFPLRLHARETASRAGSTALADSDRTNRSWGAEWNLTLGRNQNVRLFHERSGFELTSPVALEERRENSLADYRWRGSDSELGLRYGRYDSRERVNGTVFRRDDAAINYRTRFAGRATWMLNAHHTASDALFSTGATDALTVRRLVSVLDLSGLGRLRWSVGYDFGDTAGRFVTSTNHTLRVRSRAHVAEHWELWSGVVGGTVVGDSSGVRREQELAGSQLGLRYSRGFSRLHYDASVYGGYTRTTFSLEPDRAMLNGGAETGLQVPVGEGHELSARASWRQEENDTSGLGYSYDEARASLGWEERLGRGTRLHLSVYGQQTTRDTFDYGVQSSEEIGAEASLSGRRGGLSLTIASSDGVTDYVPDPADGSIFVPDTDLVSSSDTATLGARWQLPHRLMLRIQGRYQDRDFSTVGRERVVTLTPQLDWSYRVWTLSARFSRYQREDGTAFAEDTWALRVSRRFY